MSLFPKERDLTRPADRVELVVDASAMGLKTSEVHVRLDSFLVKHLSWRSRSSIQSLIREGFVLTDPSTPEHPQGSGTAVEDRRPGRKLKHGSRVTVIIPPELRLPQIDASAGELDVLYEDDVCLAVDKPPFLPVHPSGRHMSDTLIQRVHARYRDVEVPFDGAPRLCHRIDRETSGIVLVAKNPEAHRRLMLQFEARSVEKEYLALVHGVPQWEEGSITFALGSSRSSSVRLKMAVRSDGLESRTDWRLIESRGNYSLIACKLFTGRQHQIRVHLSAIGHPIVGDKLYGASEEYFMKHAADELTERDLDELELPRHALHNHRLAFDSPLDGKRVEVVSPLAPDLAQFLSEV
jgi:23S rRNA pseudouridine1911/1915/1917 synthase